MSELTFAPDDGTARRLRLVPKDELKACLSELKAPERAWIEASGFKANAGQLALIPSAEGGVQWALGGMGDGKDRARKRFVAGSLRGKLPEGLWRFDTRLTGPDLDEAALGWL